MNAPDKLSVAGATTYERGVHGDRWAGVAYRVNETTMLRGTVEDGTPSFADGAVVARC